MEAGHVFAPDRCGGTNRFGDRMPPQVEHPAAHQDDEALKRRSREARHEMLEKIAKRGYCCRVRHERLPARRVGLAISLLAENALNGQNPCTSRSREARH